MNDVAKIGFNAQNKW